MSHRRTFAALAGAIVLQILLSGFTQLFPGDGGPFGRGLHGSPLPVGSFSGGSFFGIGDGEPTVFWPVLGLNVVLTAAGLWLLLRLGGQALLVPLGGVLFFVLAAVMYLRLDSWPGFAGFPLPIATDEDRSVALFALWIDAMAGAALFALPSLWRRRTSVQDAVSPPA